MLNKAPRRGSRWPTARAWSRALLRLNLASLRAVLRKLPGVLGDDLSAVEESFSAALEGAPEYPHYTRPASWRGWEVPEVLLSGHHARVDEWRRAQSRRRADRPLP